MVSEALASFVRWTPQASATDRHRHQTRPSTGSAGNPPVRLWRRARAHEEGSHGDRSAGVNECCGRNAAKPMAIALHARRADAEQNGSCQRNDRGHHSEAGHLVARQPRSGQTKRRFMDAKERRHDLDLDGRSFLNSRLDSPVQDERLAPSMMIAIPSRQTLTPIQSLAVGWTLSTAHNQAIATAM